MVCRDKGLFSLLFFMWCFLLKIFIFPHLISIVLLPLYVLALERKAQGSVLSGARSTQASWASSSPYLVSQGSEREITKIHVTRCNHFLLMKNSLPGWKTIFSGSDLPRSCNDLLFCAKNINQSKSPSPMKGRWDPGRAHPRIVIPVFGASVNVRRNTGIILPLFGFLSPPPSLLFYIISWLPPHPSQFCCFRPLYYPQFKSVGPLGWRVI